MASPEPRCRTRGLKKSFGGNPILKGIDLEVPEGSFAVLVGPSGCGKSTLLRLVAGLETPDEGTIHIGDRDVTQLAPRERDIAMVFQSYALYPHLTVRDNLAFGLKLRGAPASEIATRIAEASAMLGLDSLLARLPKQLSGGQRQRVAMGRAIVRRAQMFLFDEPLSNLDAALRAEVRVDIRKLHDRLGATTLYVTHDQVEAMTLADTLWVLNGGKVEQRGAPLEVYERPRSKFVATFLGSPKMNLIDATLRKTAAGAFVADAPGVEVPVDVTRFGGALADGRAVTLGMRPHDLLPATNGGASLRLDVDLIEALGFEAIAHGSVGKTKFVARLDAALAKRVRANDELPLAIASDRVHLFDPESGAALDAS
jgi:sn-glycerol 3-phosphate transport system ATP-binding protein/multiple sugar transport system ATP-binding protein